MEELADVIRATILPDSWREESGTVGSIRVHGDVLVITHSRPAHQEIGRLLAALRGEPPTKPEPFPPE